MMGWTKQRFSHHKVTWWARQNEEFLITKWHGWWDGQNKAWENLCFVQPIIHVTLWWENLCFV
jgi:hypothetical protein